VVLERVRVAEDQAHEGAPSFDSLVTSSAIASSVAVDVYQLRESAGGNPVTCRPGAEEQFYHLMQSEAWRAALDAFGPERSLRYVIAEREPGLGLTLTIRVLCPGNAPPLPALISL